ncbi:glycosyltransferase family 2 protein [Candidatus Oscillochloris fontis]|uniref:glycosyltransferase family 2 protein n=1 Tax=Candidatus Oscillochloris fontis TaxID=2496868 RepID=UPI00101C8987|nr:glycosyltransferase family 2 protein [Candidatus Oscillochloris fontis]
MVLTDPPTITTIIPTYRRPQLLRRAIQSVLAQTYPHFQIWVYDNASGDETADVVAEMAARDPRIHYYCHPTNIGSMPNFQFGLNRVATPFFSFLSDDDLILPNFYQTALAGFQAHPAAIFSATNVLCRDYQDRLLAVSNLQSGFYPTPEGLLMMLRREHPTWTGILFRREVLETVHEFDLATGIISDFDFELRIAAHHAFVFNEEPGAVFYMHPSSLSQVEFANYQRIWPACEHVRANMMRHEHLTPTVRAEADRLLDAWIYRSLMFISIVATLRWQFEDALRSVDLMTRYTTSRAQVRGLFLIIRLLQAFPLLIFPLRWKYETLRIIRRFLLHIRLALRGIG